MPAVWAIDHRDSELDVGVIYTHEREFLPRLLTTLQDSAAGLAVRLLLVDNASDDGTAPWERLVPHTTVLHNRERLGYAPNLNRILRSSRAPLILLLNTDMYFDPAEQCLVRMVRFMEQHPDCGVSACRLYHPDGRYAYPARRFQTLRTIVGRRAGLGGLLSRELDQHLYRDRSPHDVFDCDWLSGCFLMVRREAYEEVGDFDCGFAKYFEDVDFCLRMARAGWRVMFNGETCCYHWEQRASNRLMSRDALQHLRSYTRWLAKWGFDPGRTVEPNTRRKAA